MGTGDVTAEAVGGGHVAVSQRIQAARRSWER